MPKGVYTDSRTSLGGAYPLVVKANRHDFALTYVTFGPRPKRALDQYQKALRGR